MPQEKKPRGTPRHAFRCPDHLWQAARDLADERGDDLATVLRTALERYVQRGTR